MVEISPSGIRGYLSSSLHCMTSISTMAPPPGDMLQNLCFAAISRRNAMHAMWLDTTLCQST